jgi:hypothetical protein
MFDNPQPDRTLRIKIRAVLTVTASDLRFDQVTIG